MSPDINSKSCNIT